MTNKKDAFNLYLNLKIPSGDSFRFPLKEFYSTEYRGEIFFKDILDIKSVRKRKQSFAIKITLVENHPACMFLYSEEFKIKSLGNFILSTLQAKWLKSTQEVSKPDLMTELEVYYDSYEFELRSLSPVLASIFTDYVHPHKLHHIKMQSVLNDPNHPAFILAYDYRNFIIGTSIHYPTLAACKKVFDELEEALNRLKQLKPPFEKITTKRDDNDGIQQ